MKSAGKARSNGLYRHIRTSKEIIRNLLNDSHNNQKNQELQNPAYPLVALLYWVYYLLQVYSFFRT